MRSTAEFEAAVDRQVEQFLRRLPGLAEGDAVAEARRIAVDLLRRGVEPYRTLQLVTAWGVAVARPPLDPEVAAGLVDKVAACILEEAT